MPDPPSFDQVCNEFRHFRHMIGKVMANTNESGIRQQLEEVTRGMDENFSELLVAYPQAEAEFDRYRVETKQNIQSVKQNAARVRAEVAKAEKAKAAAAAAPEVPKTPKPPAPVDLKLGPKLRAELLDHCADPEVDQSAAAAKVLEAWQDWDGAAWEKKLIEAAVTQLARDTIPFEGQRPAAADRMCGAASLAMVYRSFGKHASQRRIWERIARPGANGRRAARTNLLAVNALHHGLSALVVQASDPWQTLVQSAAGVRVILNHRLEADSPLGHYTVLVEIEDRHVVLHDPQFGANRRLERDQLLDLWQPTSGPCEIVGNILVAIAPSEEGNAACGLCGTAVPKSVVCPGCKSTIPLQPVAALGCAQEDCQARTWRYLFCPYCDRSLSEMPSHSHATTCP